MMGVRPISALRVRKSHHGSIFTHGASDYSSLVPFLLLPRGTLKEELASKLLSVAGRQHEEPSSCSVYCLSRRYSLIAEQLLASEGLLPEMWLMITFCEPAPQISRSSYSKVDKEHSLSSGGTARKFFFQWSFVIVPILNVVNIV